MLKKPKSVKPKKGKKSKFKCQKCDSEFKDEDNYKSHLVTHIKSMKKRIAMTLKDFNVTQIEAFVNCDKCFNNEFENIEAYDEHIKKEHLQDAKLLQEPRVELERLSDKVIYTKPIPDSGSGHWFSSDLEQDPQIEIKEEIIDIETSDTLSLSPVTPKISSVTSLSVTPLNVKVVTPKLPVTLHKLTLTPNVSVTPKLNVTPVTPVTHLTPVTPNVSVTQIISGTSNEPVKLRAFVTPKTTVTQEDVETQCDLESEEKTVTQNSKEYKVWVREQRKKENRGTQCDKGFEDLYGPGQGVHSALEYTRFPLDPFNVWKAKSPADFCFFNCPECNFSEKSFKAFFNHAVYYHKKRDLLDMFQTEDLEKVWEYKTEDYYNENKENLLEDDENDDSGKKFFILDELWTCPHCSIKTRSADVKYHHFCEESI